MEQGRRTSGFRELWQETPGMDLFLNGKRRYVCSLGALQRASFRGTGGLLVTWQLSPQCTNFVSVCASRRRCGPGRNGKWCNQNMSFKL